MKAIYKKYIFKDIIFNLPVQNNTEPQFAMNLDYSGDNWQKTD
jgi:hypothetical protein